MPEQEPKQTETRVMGLQGKPMPGFLGHASPPEKSGTGMDRKVKRRWWTPVRIAGIGAAALFVGAVLYIAIFGDHSAKLNVQVERIVISEVVRGPFQEFIVIRGTVMPIQTHYLDALEGGQIQEIFLEEGAMVEPGTPILRLSNPNTEQRVLSQEATLFEQINNMENTRLNQEIQAIARKRDLMNIELNVQQAEREYNRARELRERNLISPDDFSTAQERYEHNQRLKAFMVETVRSDSLYRINELAALETRAKSLQRQLDDVRRPLDNLTVRSPIRGQLSALNAQIGQLISTGARIGQVDVLDGYKVRAGIDEFYIARIAQGLKGSAQVAGRAYDLEIRRVYPGVRDGQFEVDMEFTGATPEGIRRGQTLQIRLELDAPGEALLLARGGFYQTTGGNWVFVVDPSGDVAVRRPVRIGRQNPEYFEILDGLQPGERVVTSSYEHYEAIEKLISNW